MYCPNCAHENQPDIKFCTRCGTNLAVVSVALSGNVVGRDVIDSRLAEVIKDYYHGRRDTITGLVLLPAAVKAVSLLILLGLPPVASFFIVSWMVFWGIAALARGLGKWVAASGEMKALGYTPPSSKLWMRAQKLLSSASTSDDAKRSTNKLSGRIEIPASVTEHTTRELEARGRATPMEHQEEKRISRTVQFAVTATRPMDEKLFLRLKRVDPAANITAYRCSTSYFLTHNLL